MNTGADKQNKDSSKGEEEFNIQPIQHGVDPKLAPFHSHPGPAMAKDMPQQEGTKEDRQARKEELNK